MATSAEHKTPSSYAFLKSPFLRFRNVTWRFLSSFKKAYELGVLCSADVAIIVFNANGKLFE
jgi:hypothetical protein